MAEKDVRFTGEEMTDINSLQQTYVNIQNTMGQVQVSRIRLEQQLSDLDKTEDELKTQFFETQNKENKLVADINKKYGDGNLDLKTGVFTPRESDGTPDKTL